MNTLIALFMASIPKAFMMIASKIMTEEFAQKIIETIIIYGLRKLAKLTSSPVDDKIVEDIIQQIKGTDYVKPE